MTPNAALYQGLATQLAPPLPEAQWGFDNTPTATHMIREGKAVAGGSRVQPV
jgi:hypothetical protein